MSFTSTIRVKEKIRYDINVHREQNKQILLNSRRGVIVDEEDTNDVFTIKDMENLAFKIKDRKNVTVKHLRVLKHALLNGQEFILAFYHVQGAIDSLMRIVSSKFQRLPTYKDYSNSESISIIHCLYLFQVKMKLCDWQRLNVFVIWH